MTIQRTGGSYGSIARPPGGANTVIGTSNGDSLLGVAHRINFMVALGSGEAIVGGSRADQLGALGRNATIRGGAGNDLIHGGRGHDVIYGGSGNDLIIDHKGTATIRTGTGRNEVKVTGHRGRDQVLCAPGSVDRIFADRGDYIAPSCREAPGSRVVYHRPPRSAQRARDPNGCINNPHVNCTFLAASGSLQGFWWSQKTPQRQCPPRDHSLVAEGRVSLGQWTVEAIAGDRASTRLRGTGFRALSQAGIAERFDAGSGFGV